MNPTRILTPLAWVRFALIEVVIGLLGGAALAHHQPGIGWAAIGFIIFWATIRIWLVRTIRRATVRAEISPTR